MEKEHIPGAVKGSLINDKDEENLIVALHDQISKLKRQNSQISEKCKGLTDQLDREKRKVASLKQTIQRSQQPFPSNNKGSMVNASKENMVNILPPSSIQGDFEIRPAATPFGQKRGFAETISAATPNNQSIPATNAAMDSNLLEIANKLKKRLELIMSHRKYKYVIIFIVKHFS